MSPKYKAIIVDDEASARSILKQLIHLYCPYIEVIDSCEELETAAISIKKNKPDLVFLDIEMPNYAGYEIPRFFDKIDFEIVFVTAYDSYAIKAFEIAAFDYLLKPIETTRLIKTLERFKEKSSIKTKQMNYEVLKEGLEKAKVEKIIVNHKGDQKVVATNTIVAMEADESYTIIRTSDGEQYTMSKNLKYFEKIFKDNSTFFRSHKSWIINLNHMLQFSTKELQIELEGGIIAKLSKYKKAEFDQLILKP